MRLFRKIHPCASPKGPGQPGLLSRVWEECYDKAGFPMAFRVRAELGNSRPLDLQMAYLGALLSWPEALNVGSLLQDGILGKLNHHRAWRGHYLLTQWLISKTLLLDSEFVPGFLLHSCLSRLPAPKERIHFCSPALEPGPRLGTGRRKQAAGLKPEGALKIIPECQGYLLAVVIRAVRLLT